MADKFSYPGQCCVGVLFLWLVRLELVKGRTVNSLYYPDHESDRDVSSDYRPKSKLL